MNRAGRTWLVFTLLVSGIGSAHAQSCLGYPAFPTGRINASTDVIVGSDFGGLGADVNIGNRKSGPFASVGAGAIRYVVDPKETRISGGALIGYEHYNKDQLIWCPVVSASYERGSDYDSPDGKEHKAGMFFGAGLSVGFELERRGRLSFNPFLSARVTRVNTKTTNDLGTTSIGETGTTFGFGLGVRFNDAIQITPSMNGSTFEGSNLVFDLRFSVALQLRKN